MAYNGSIKTFDTIADLKSQKGSPNIKVNVLGYTTSNDGGGGEFYWNDTSTTADNGGTVFQVTGVTTGRWIRNFVGSEIKVKWFGAKGDGVTDDTSIISSCITAASSGNLTLVLDKGTYVIKGATTATSALTITSAVKIFGEEGAIIKETQRHTVPFIQITGVTVTLQNLTISGFETQADFDSTDSTRYGIRLTNSNFSVLRNITVSGKSRAIGTFNCNDTVIENPTIYGLFQSVAPASPANFSNGVFVSGGSRNKVINPIAYGVGNCVLVGAGSTYGQIVGGSVNVAYDCGVYVSSGVGWSVSQFTAIFPGGTGIKIRGSGHSVIGCKIRDCVVGISATGDGALNSYGDNGRGHVVMGNYIINTSADGIGLGGQDAGYAFGTIVEGNTMNNVATDGGVYAGIRAGGQNLKLVNNEFVNIQSDAAIVLGNTVKHSIISGNRFTDCNGGIFAVAVDRCQFTYNNFKSCGNNPAIELDANCTNNLISWNATDDGFTGTSEITVPESTTIVNNNIVRLFKTSVYSIPNIKNRVHDGNAEVTSNTLPTADTTQRGRTVYVRTSAATTELAYLCRRKSDLTFEWVPIGLRYQGSGSPEGVVTAGIGEMYSDTANDNSATSKIYAKISGTGNVGWEQLATVPNIRTAPGSAGVGMIPSDGTVLLANTTTGNVQLPNPTLVAGRTFVIKKTSNNGVVLTVVPFASETIDGASTYTLNFYNAWVAVQSDGTNWYIVASSRIPTGNNDYILNQSASAQTSSNFWISGLGKTNNGLQVNKDGADSVLTGIRLSNSADTRGANFQLTAGTTPGLATWLHDGTSWVERMRILSNGNVGIGLNAPNTLLHVSGAATITGGVLSTGVTQIVDNSSLRLSGGTQFGNQGAHIALRGGTNVNTPGEMTFHTGTGTGDQPERMRITSAGNVGIGKTPTTMLDVNGAITAAGSISNGQFTADGLGGVSCTSLLVSGNVRFSTGSPASGKIWTSDASGNGSWQTPAAVGILTIGNATNANYTAPDNVDWIILPTITANRTLTLPSPTTNSGKIIYILNKDTNSPIFGWSPSPALVYPSNTLMTGLGNNTAITIISDGTNWRVMTVFNG